MQYEIVIKTSGSSHCVIPLGNHRNFTDAKKAARDYVEHHPFFKEKDYTVRECKHE